MTRALWSLLYPRTCRPKDYLYFHLVRVTAPGNVKAQKSVTLPCPALCFATLSPETVGKYRSLHFAIPRFIHVNESLHLQDGYLFP